MDYFWIRQDHRYKNPPVIANMNAMFRRKDVCIEHSYKIPGRNVVFSKSEHELDNLDILDSQLFLVNDKVKSVFEIYEKSMTYKMFCILNNATNSYYKYYAPIFFEVDCLMPEDKAGFHNKELPVLYKSNIENYSIFRVINKSKEIIVVRLDVMESLLRRDLNKLQFTYLNLK